MIPGLPSGRFAVSALSVSINADALDLNIWEMVGSPAAPVSVQVRIAPGVLVGGTDTANATTMGSIVCGTFHPESTIDIFNYGSIRGAGGRGGDGSAGREPQTGQSSSANFRGGGGGGGAGHLPGLKGLAYSAAGGNATDGSDGTNTDPGGGGAGGANDTSSGSVAWLQGASQEEGGSCIIGDPVTSTLLPRYTTRIHNYGTIWAGAPGGRGGYRTSDNLDGPPRAGTDYGVTFAPLAGRSGYAYYNCNLIVGGTPEALKGRAFEKLP